MQSTQKQKIDFDAQGFSFIDVTRHFLIHFGGDYNIASKDIIANELELLSLFKIQTGYFSV